MASLVEHFVMPSTIEWHHDEAHDAIMITITTKAYTLLHLGLSRWYSWGPSHSCTYWSSEFLQPPPTLPDYKLVLKFEPIQKPKPLPVYDTLLEFEPMFPNLPPLEPIIRGASYWDKFIWLSYPSISASPGIKLIWVGSFWGNVYSC